MKYLNSLLVEFEVSIGYLTLFSREGVQPTCVRCSKYLLSIFPGPLGMRTCPPDGRSVWLTLIGSLSLKFRDDFDQSWLGKKIIRRKPRWEKSGYIFPWLSLSWDNDNWLHPLTGGKGLYQVNVCMLLFLSGFSNSPLFTSLILG